MAEIEKIQQWYEDHKSIYEGFAQKVSELLKILIEEEQIPYHSISYRVKTKSSYIEKCSRKKYENPAENVMDFAGIRIIAYTTADVDRICNIIDKEFFIDKENSGNKAELLNSDKVGYLSIHYVAALSSERLALKEYGRYKDLVCEIQVRTLLQHAWAEIEHDRSYKFSGVLPISIRRRFHLIAGVLEMMDSEFQRLSDEIDLHVENVRKETECGNLNIPLDSASLMEYISTKIMNPDIAKTFNHHDQEIIEELHAFGIDSISQLEPLFSDSFCKVINERTEMAESENFLSVLRDAMICYNTELYFENAWNMRWTGYDSYARRLWEECGVDLNIIRRYLEEDSEEFTTNI